ncbi:MAG: hypothetical protein JWP29_1957 [Rhodoferax sp.]|nr:hypothetical protein [Rhodoferax sp.]
MNMLSTIMPKSDQLNADELIGGPRTITVTKVSLLSEEQPVAVHFEGDNGKPYKPGKSMRRVMVMVWGADASTYAGRSMTLYRDDTVLFGGMAVGGIRISHMSHLAAEKSMALTATKGKKRLFTVKPLIVQKQEPDAPAPDKVAKGVAELVKWLKATGKAEFQRWLVDPDALTKREWVAANRPELATQLDKAVADASARFGEDEPVQSDEPPPNTENDEAPASMSPAALAIIEVVEMAEDIKALTGFLHKPETQTAIEGLDDVSHSAVSTAVSAAKMGFTRVRA